jgi:hypothetical protein
VLIWLEPELVDNLFDASFGSGGHQVGFVEDIRNGGNGNTCGGGDVAHLRLGVRDRAARGQTVSRSGKNVLFTAHS